MDERLLIVDDDRRLQDLLREYLSGFGFRTISVFSGDGLADRVREHSPELVILDVMLPGRDGLEALRELRRESAVPVIMLTARGDETDRIVGLEVGADDYLPKPFNPRELLARVRAILRRAHESGTIQGPPDAPSGATTAGAVPARRLHLQSGGLVFDPVNRTVAYNGKQGELSSAEAQLLESLMQRPNQTLSRDELMNLTRGRDFMGYERSIDVHVSRIRAKLGELGVDKDRIRTVWGTGYIFVQTEPSA